MIRILLLGLVLAGVYYLYRMVTQQNAGTTPVPAANDATPVAAPATDQPADQPAEPVADEPPGPTGSEQAAPLEDTGLAAEAQEMMECPLCQAYVPEAAHDGCGRPDCPIPALAASRDMPPQG